MESPEQHSESAEVIADRRRGDRTTVFENTVARDLDTDREIPVWVVNHSDTGMQFRTRERLSKGVRMAIGGESPADVEVVRVEPQGGGVWEYGARLIATNDPGESDLNLWQYDLVALPADLPQSTSRPARKVQKAVSDIAESAAAELRYREEWNRKRSTFCCAALVCLAAGIFSILGLFSLPHSTNVIVTGLACVCGWIGVWHGAAVHRRRIERAENELLGRS